MTKDFIEPIKLFHQEYPNAKQMQRKRAFSGWFALMQDSANHAALAEFIERLAAENYSMSNNPTHPDQNTVYHFDHSFSREVQKRTDEEINYWKDFVYAAIRTELASLKPSESITLTARIAERVGYERASSEC